jgi:type VI secretion system protein ImpF
MSTFSRHTLLQPSVLDRLLDDHPDNSSHDHAALYELPQFKQSLARDLEALLNTRLMPAEVRDDDYRWRAAACSTTAFPTSAASAC